MLNPVYALLIKLDEEERIIERIIRFSWDSERISVARNGSQLLVNFSEPLDRDAQNRLGRILRAQCGFLARGCSVAVADCS